MILPIPPPVGLSLLLLFEFSLFPGLGVGTPGAGATPVTLFPGSGELLWSAIAVGEPLFTETSLLPGNVGATRVGPPFEAGTGVFLVTVTVTADCTSDANAVGGRDSFGSDSVVSSGLVPSTEDVPVAAVECTALETDGAEGAGIVVQLPHIPDTELLTYVTVVQVVMLDMDTLAYGGPRDTVVFVAGTRLVVHSALAEISVEIDVVDSGVVKPGTTTSEHGGGGV